MSRTSFPFFALPAELRHQIYQVLQDNDNCQVFIEDDGRMMKNAASWSSARRQRHIFLAPLVRVCSRMRRETVHMLYSEHVFNFTSVTALESFMCRVPSQLHRLRYLRIQGYPSEPLDLVHLIRCLSHFPLEFRLKRLHISTITKQRYWYQQPHGLLEVVQSVWPRLEKLCLLLKEVAYPDTCAIGPSSKSGGIRSYLHPDSVEWVIIHDPQS
jgi:hypothetical protein